MNIEEEINSDRNHGTLSSTYNAKGNTAQVLDLQAAQDSKKVKLLTNSKANFMKALGNLDIKKSIKTTVHKIFEQD